MSEETPYPTQEQLFAKWLDDNCPAHLRPHATPEAQAAYEAKLEAAEVARVEAEKKAAQNRLDHIARMTQASIPNSYQWANFGDLGLLGQRTDKAAIGNAMRAVTANATRVILTGNPRAGKTSLACAMLRRWSAERQERAVFCHAFRLGIARIQHKAGQGEAEEVERAMFAPLLLIDDVGSERDTQNNAIVDVVFERHAEERPTWITTGLSSAQLISRYGAGFFGRISEHAIVIQVGPKGAS